ncbi:MAG: alpha/beta hydrolase [Spirochaetales bacterium]
MKKTHIPGRWGKIFVRDSGGKGMPVLLLHGNSQGSETFLPQLEGEVGSAFRLLAFDRLGHGNSDRAKDPDNAYTLSGCVEQIREVINYFQLQAPVWVGHSLGGHLALQALARGVACAKIFVFSAPPLKSLSSLTEAFLPHPALPSLFKGNLSNEEQVQCVEAIVSSKDTYTSLIRTLLQISDPKVRTVLAGSLQEELHDEVQALHQASVPKAVGIGEKDLLVNRQYLERVLPPDVWRKKLILFPNSSHTPQLENPDIFNQILLDFLA